MDHPAPDQNVGSSVPFVAIIATVVALAVIIGGFYAYRTLSGDQARHQIVVATGFQRRCHLRMKIETASSAVQ